MLAVTRDIRRPSNHQYTIMMSPHTHIHTHTQYAIIIQDMRSKWWFTCLYIMVASLSVQLPNELRA